MGMTRAAPATVTAYIAAAPAPARTMLRALRAAIRAAAPRATEAISYGMPYYGQAGRLIYFAAYKRHIGVYVMGRGKKVYEKELKTYQTSKATLQFPIGALVPVALVKKLVRYRVKENLAAAAVKKR
jgi:uncharacterized protein YdhG (YjbR/CyaY superfamily)